MPRVHRITGAEKNNAGFERLVGIVISLLRLACSL